MSVLAVGGYGRGALAPFSDIDLLFLRPYKPTPHTESVIEYMLYALWDLGFKVGHASRTVDECIKLSREDFTIRTSILEARRLTGDEAAWPRACDAASARRWSRARRSSSWRPS